MNGMECARSRCLSWSRGKCMIGGCQDRVLPAGVFRCPGCREEFAEPAGLQGHFAANATCRDEAAKALRRAQWTLV